MRKAVTIKGVTYASIKALAQSYGIKTDYIYRRINKNNETLEEVISILENKAFYINGARYYSIQKACDDLGISHNRVRRRIKTHGESIEVAIEYVLNHPARIMFMDWCKDNDRIDLINEFVRDKTNPDVDISSLSYASHDYAEWRCTKCNNRWIAQVKERTIGQTGCPVCKHYFKTSAPEQAVYFYIKKCFPDAVNSFTAQYLGNMEIDVYIPSIMVGIEYDGGFWHSNPERDLQKAQRLKTNGVTLIRIREKTAPILNDGSIVILTEDVSDDLSALKPSIIELFHIINEKYNANATVDVDIKRDYQSILSCSEITSYSKSLLAANPVALKEWDYKKNKDFTPDRITAHSRKMAWWTCSKCGKSWLQPINTKVRSGLWCESCNKTRANNERNLKAIQKGEKRAVADDPYLLSEWDPNNTLDPYQTAIGSEKEAKWICSRCGNYFKQVIKNRSGPQKQGCPKCGRKSQAKMRGHAVRNIDTGEVFESLSAASRRYSKGLTASTNIIRDCCQGKTRHAYGYRWEYVSKDEQV